MLKPLLLLLVLDLINARSNGPPSQSVVCEDISPDPSPSFHGPTQGGNGGYVIATDLPLSATPGFYDYEGGMTYTVQIQSTGGTAFLGFLVQARDNNGDGIGAFVEADLESDQQIQDCTLSGFADGTTVSHSAATPDVTETFTWEAPMGAGGLVDFRYAVVVTRFVYYNDQSAAANSALAGPIIGPATTLPTPPPTPPPGIIAPDLAPENYTLTFRSPPDCNVSECDIFAGIETNLGNPDYLDIYLEGNARSWVALGFTDTPDMFSADVVACNVGSGEIVEVLDTWNLDTGRGNVVDRIQDVYPFSSNFTGDRIICSFTKFINGSDVPTQDLDLRDNHYVLYGANPLSAMPGQLRPHPPGVGSPLITATLANAANLELLNITGPLQLVTPPERELEDYRITARFPDDCLPSECDLFVGIDTNVGDTEFLDIYMEGNADGWIAVGFTSTPNMFDADVLGCSINPTTNVVEIVDTWNVGSPDRDNERDSIQDIRPFSTSSTSGRITCSFARSIAGSNVGTEDLSLDQAYFILFGVSPNSREGSLSFHTFGAGNPMISAEMVDPSEQMIDIGANNRVAIRIMLTRAHGIIMIIAWPLLAVTAIFFAAWMRPALPNGEWFQVHRAFMLGSLFVGAVGFLLIFVAQYDRSPNPGLIDLGSTNPTGTAHFAIGILVMLLHIVNPIISAFRCHPGTPNRWIFDLLHGTLIGLFAEILALINVGIGLALFSENFSVFADNGGDSLTLAYIYIAWAVFFVAMIFVLFLIFTVLAFTSDEEGRAKLAPSLIKPLAGSGSGSKSSNYQGGVELTVPGQKAPQPAADGPKPPSRDAPVRWIALAIFALVTIAIMIALIVLVAI